MKKIGITQLFLILALTAIIGMINLLCKKADTVTTPQIQLSRDSINSDIAYEVYICSCKPNLVNASGDQTIAFQGRFFGSGIYADCDERYLLQFNLDSIPINTKIIHAQLQLYCLEMHGTPENKMIYESITEQWQSNTTTYNAKPTTDTLNRILTDWPTTQQWHLVDLTPFVKEWIEMKRPNYGIMCYSMEESSTASAKYSTSKNSRKDIRPVLRIWFES